MDQNTIRLEKNKVMRRINKDYKIIINEIVEPFDLEDKIKILDIINGFAQKMNENNVFQNINADDFLNAIRPYDSKISGKAIQKLIDFFSERVVHNYFESKNVNFIESRGVSFSFQIGLNIGKVGESYLNAGNELNKKFEYILEYISSNKMLTKSPVEQIEWTGKKVDFIKLVYSLHRAKLINKGNGSILKTTDLLAKIFKVDYTEGSNDLSKSLNNADRLSYTKDKFIKEIRAGFELYLNDLGMSIESEIPTKSKKD